MDSALNAAFTAWGLVRSHYAAYELVAPGSPGFICLQGECPEHCCRKFTVNLGEAEVERLARYSQLEPVAFLESEGGQPIALPLAQPYVLSRTDGRCTLLGDDLVCSQYHARPEACRLYPHFVVAISRETSRPVYSDIEGINRAVTAAIRGETDRWLTPLLLRHLDCPGFGGPPLTANGWRELFGKTCATQYPLAPPAA